MLYQIRRALPRCGDSGGVEERGSHQQPREEPASETHHRQPESCDRSGPGRPYRPPRQKGAGRKNRVENLAAPVLLLLLAKPGALAVLVEEPSADADSEGAGNSKAAPPAEQQQMVPCPASR